MKACVFVGVLVTVGFAVGKARVPEVRTCHLCLFEDAYLGCLTGSEKCTISSTSPCMVITIVENVKSRFIIRGCGQHNNYRCQEQHTTYFPKYWYSAQCCQFDYCNAWFSPQLRSSLSEPPKGSLAKPLTDSQIYHFYRALNLSLPLPSFPAGREPLTALPPELGLSIASLRRIYLFLNSSGLLVLPRRGP